MNQSPSGSLLLSKAIAGFINYKNAERLSARTIDSHERILAKWLEHIGDQELQKITSQEAIAYINWLRNGYVPHRYSGKTYTLAAKTLRNVWATLSSFFSWASLDLGIKQIMKDVPAPKTKQVAIEPLTQDEVLRMLKVCVYSREVKPGNRKGFVMRLPNANRDQAIILPSLDTGLWAMEMCKLQIGDIDLKTGRIEVKHGVIGGAKGGKGRTVYLGKSIRRALWRYLTEHEDENDLEAPVFLAQNGRPFNPNSLRQLIKGIAERCEVKNAYPHKFIHTFAITY